MGDEEGIIFAQPGDAWPFVTLSGIPVFFAEPGDAFPLRIGPGLAGEFSLPGDGFETPAHTVHEELIEGLDKNFIRFCPIHRLPHDADPVHYFGGGRLCPAGGEPLRGYLTRFRDIDGAPEMNLPDWWGPEG